MSIQTIVKYNKLRAQMTPDELKLADTLYEASEAEKALLVESLSPEKPAGRTRKKAAGKKSVRAASLSEKIQGTAGPKSIDGGVSKMRCIQEGCGEYADNPIHDSLMGYRGYHEFDSGQQAATASGD